jgi:hypothetical protein
MHKSFLELEYAGEKKRTRQDHFRAELDAVTPQAEWIAVL